MRWPWPRRRRPHRIALASLTLGRYLAALRALGVADGTAPEIATLPAATLLRFLDVMEDGEPLHFADEDALRAHAALVWGTVAAQVMAAGATARREAEAVEQHYLHFLPAPDADGGALPPPLAAALARAEGADYVALLALPIEEALCYLACRSVVMDYDRAERESEREGLTWDEDLARN